MSNKQCLVLLFGVALAAVTSVLIFQSTSIDYHSEVDAKPTEELHQQPSAVTTVDSINQNPVSPISMKATPHNGGPLKDLRRELLVSGEDLLDAKKVIRQEAVVSMLCRMRKPEAVSLLAEALFDPRQTYVTKGKDSSGKEITNSYVFMEALAYCLIDAPEPLNIIYSDEDLPRFESWWHANKSNLRFKPVTASK